jgi:AcrR family transcriptional regulator
MRSVAESTIPSPNSDLTTRARIRDAALDRFPREGFAATTIRAIAEDAGVSPGLVVHHFGSKEGLREACDRHVVAKFRETKLASLEDDNLGNPAFAAGSYHLAQPLLRYFSWALVRGHPAAGELFDEILREGLEVTRVAVEKGVVKGSDDLKTRTTLQMAMMLGMTVFHAHVERNTGIDVLTAEGIARLTPSLLEIFSGLFDEETLAMLGETYGEAGAS